jgi:hypothetical protein
MYIIKALNGGVREGFPDYTPTYNSVAFVTTTWRPNAECWEALHATGTIANKEIVSHSFKRLFEIYKKLREEDFSNILSEEDIMPLYWSAGVLYHYEFLQRNYNYMKKYNLLDNPDLRFVDILGGLKYGNETIAQLTKKHNTDELQWFLALISARSVRNEVDFFVMSSFEDYNVSYPAYQQVPWVANVSGLPVFTRSGNGDLLFGQQCTNYSNPMVKQRGDMTLVSYAVVMKDMYFSAAKKFDTDAIKKPTTVPINLFWPFALFGGNQWRVKQGDGAASKTLMTVVADGWQGKRSKVLESCSIRKWLCGLFEYGEFRSSY